MNANLPILTDVHLITCIVQRGRADRVVRAAIEAGAEGATIHYARGTGARQRLGALSIAVNAEKEVVTVAVSGEQRDRVFESMALAGELETPGMGFMYVLPVEHATTHIPPDILAQLGQPRDAGTQPANRPAETEEAPA